MKAHRIALPILAASALLTTGVGVAQAAEPADCGEAITVMNAADVAHRDAVAADEKAAAALDADRELLRAEHRLADAKAAVEAAIAADNEAGLTEDSPATVSAKALERTRQAEADKARVEADRTDARELGREARKTDADELKKALDDAKADFDRLCINNKPDNPEPEPADPAPADPAPTPQDDDDFSQVGVVPQGGVQTGGWLS